MVKIFKADRKLDYRAVGAVVRRYSEKRNAHIGKSHRDIGNKADAGLSDYAYLRLELAAVHRGAFPTRVDPAVDVRGIFKTRDHVRAVLLVDGYAVALRDKSDDGVAGKGITALRELDR